MNTAHTSSNASTLRQLSEVLFRQPGMEAVWASLEQGGICSIEGIRGSGGILLSAVLVDKLRRPVWVVLPRERDLDPAVAEITGLLGQPPHIFPAWGELPSCWQASDTILGRRLRALETWSSTPPRLVLSTIAALMQPVPRREERLAARRSWQVGDTINLEELAHWLVSHGYQRVPVLEYPGEFSIRGHILEIFPADTDLPIRVELFGDEIESIRTFDPVSQQKVENLSVIHISLVGSSLDVPRANENSVSRSTEGHRAIQGEHAFAELPSQACVVIIEPEECCLEAQHYRQRSTNNSGLFDCQETFNLSRGRACLLMSWLSEGQAATHAQLRMESVERLTRTRAEVLQELADVLQPGEKTLLLCHNAAALERMQELLTEHPSLQSRVICEVGWLSRGFRFTDRSSSENQSWLIISDHELFHRTEVVRAVRRSRTTARPIDSFLDLKEGDLVVHLSHGIARYHGMKILRQGEQLEEHLQLEFRDGVLIYVPVSLIHMVQKYVGGGKGAPELSRIGGTSWSKTREKVAAAVTDLAAEMLRLQAARLARPGIAYPPDSHWQREFEAEFPYSETDDQLRAIEDVKRDMESPRPMDRLICGDVGYGKTEVALRAAFKAVDAGKQVAVLVPTTVLAEQHYRSFCDRMADYPIKIAVLSRFRTRSEQQQILHEMAAGSVDIVIGTHRLLSPDVRFKDLGLLIVDEEQRFGVEAKEILKQLRLEVDVLTLSATPIPRTLHLSLLGLRDISNLETPPQDRVAIETRICRFDTALIRQAVLRELNRNGQVYFVHNRVYDIERLADRLRTIVPEATITTLHGQMSEHTIEDRMLAFVQGKVDILVATTIIESGLDIPNANTIFIHQADQYGLADLHQLRGRVGRYKHRAYCYLLLEEGKPITPIAARRLRAIEEYTELGAGFKIALQDLEIRGAGNLLGTEQSGHIAAVGYELYCQLLEQAVRRLKNEPLREHRHVNIQLPVQAYIPDDYIPPGRLKIEMYRKLSATESLSQLEALREEYRDRFGPWPASVDELFAVRELQILAVNWQIDEIRLEGEYIIFGYREVRQMHKLQRISPYPLRLLDERTACLVPSAWPLERAILLDLIKSVLQLSCEERYNSPLTVRR